MPVEGEGDFLVQEKQVNPGLYSFRVAQVSQHPPQVEFVHIVKEAFDIKQQCSTLTFGPDGALHIMHEGESHVKGAGVCPDAKLSDWGELVLVNVVQQPLGHPLLDELGQALNQGDGPVVFGQCIVSSVSLLSWYPISHDRLVLY